MDQIVSLITAKLRKRQGKCYGIYYKYNSIAIPRNPLFREGRLMTNLPHC
jgi:hypothetical protein